MRSERRLPRRRELWPAALARADRVRSCFPAEPRRQSKSAAISQVSFTGRAWRRNIRGTFPRQRANPTSKRGVAAMRIPGQGYALALCSGAVVLACALPAQQTQTAPVPVSSAPGPNRSARSDVVTPPAQAQDTAQPGGRQGGGAGPRPYARVITSEAR